jgi:hypothetical protein
MDHHHFGYIYKIGNKKAPPRSQTDLQIRKLPAFSKYLRQQKAQGTLLLLMRPFICKKGLDLGALLMFGMVVGCYSRP